MCEGGADLEPLRGRADVLCMPLALEDDICKIGQLLGLTDSGNLCGFPMGYIVFTQLLAPMTAGSKRCLLFPGLGAGGQM